MWPMHVKMFDDVNGGRAEGSMSKRDTRGNKECNHEAERQSIVQGREIGRKREGKCW